MRAGRRPSPEGTKMMFAGTISPTICLRDGQTKERHDNTKRRARKEKKREEKKRKEKKRKEKKRKERKKKRKEKKRKEKKRKE